jgi:hypothetical protein
MYYRKFVIVTILLLSVLLYQANLYAQTITPSDTKDINVAAIYLFYLHGGIVQEYGAKAVSPYYGSYEYTAILDTLDNYGFHVISEVRPKGTTEVEYAEKVKYQVDSLLASGISPKQVVVVGASAGAYIALEVALTLRNPAVNFVVIGLCSTYARNYFAPKKQKLYGKFLSIYEVSDSKGSCQEIFSDVKSFKEVALTMGIDHAFLFKPYDEWIKPLVEWVEHAQR